MNNYFEFDSRSINVIKGVSICVIVFFHIHCLTDTLSFYINNFILPAFIFTSGVLYFRYTRNRLEPGLTNWGYKLLIINKLQRLIVPYICLGITYSIMKFAFFKISGSDVDIIDSLISLLINPRSSLAPFIWFLMTLFIIFLIVHAVPAKHTTALFVFSFVLFWLSPYLPNWFCLCDVGNYLLFFMVGCYADKLTKVESTNTHGIILGLRLILFAIYVFILNLFSKSKLSRPFELLGKYSGSIYFLSSFVISIFVGLLGDSLWPVIGVLSIIIPIIIDVLSEKFKLQRFRALFLGSNK